MEENQKVVLTVIWSFLIVFGLIIINQEKRMNVLENQPKSYDGNYAHDQNYFLELKKEVDASNRLGFDGNWFCANAVPQYELDGNTLRVSSVSCKFWVWGKNGS